METTTQEPTINYPDWLDEEKFGLIISNVLSCIDRAKLFADSRLVRVRHPLLQQEIGSEVALNTEMLCMLEDIALGVSANIKEHSNHAELISRLEYVEQMLMENAVDAKKIEDFLLQLVEAIDELNKLNPVPDGNFPPGPSIVDNVVRKQLKLPTLAQDLVLYPAVTTDRYEGREEVLQVLEACRADLLGRVADPVIREEIEGISTRVRAWLKLQL